MRLTPLLCLLGAWMCPAQTNPTTYTVNTFAGSVPSGDGGPAASAILRWPGSLVFDTAGNLHEVDSGSASVRKITPDGLISTVAGTGITGFSGDGGTANQAQLGASILRVRKIDATGGAGVPGESLSCSGNNL